MAFVHIFSFLLLLMYDYFDQYMVSIRWRLPYCSS